MDPDEGAPYLLHLLGVKEGTDRLAPLNPEAIKARCFDTLRQMSLRGSRQRPIIFALEDLHWIDKTSEEFFATLMESLPGASILVVTTYRPGYRPPWIEKSYATQLALRPLSRQDSLTVVRSVLERDEVADPIAQVVLNRADGNPFFLEELTRAVVEHGDLHSTLAVPDTIQGVLTARIDRLPDKSKRLLQTASVLGREFSLRLLGAIWEGPGALTPHLAELRRLEFLYEQSRGEEPAGVFRHALTQEVAYESLLTPRRQALHTAAGRALEALHADRLAEVYDRLAYHYARTEDAVKAVEYLTRFGEKAARGYAHTEALTALQEALVHAERLPAEEQDRRVLDLCLRRANSLRYLGRWQESVDLLLQHQARLDRLESPALAGPYYFMLGYTYSFLGDLEHTRQNLMRAFAEATACGDEVTMGKAGVLAATARIWTGQLVQAVELGRQAVARLERTDERPWLGAAHYMLAFGHTLSGDHELALEAAARVDAIGTTIGDRRLQVMAASTAGLTYATRGDCDAAIEACQRALERSLERFDTALVLGFLGYAHHENGDPAQAIPILEQAVEQANRYRSPHVRGWFATWLGDAYLSAGQIGKARDLVRLGLGTCAGSGFVPGVGWSQRVMGRIAQASGAPAEAETHLRTALETFGSGHARLDVGRTHLDLATLAGSQGRREAVATHLREARSTFRALRVPKYVARAERLAAEFGVPLLEHETPG